MTLIKELIELPEHVYRGDFVLRLTEGVTKPEETLRDYVVTPELAKCFDDALGFIHSALDAHSSKASYLHGSFGSGKSHFMAVLHLLLQGVPQARSIPELAPVIAKHNAWIQGKRFLLVPYHMIGALSMESAILGGYVEHVQALHPEAPLPGVYLAEAIFRDAVQLRQRMGDGPFFEQLNVAAGAGGAGWGTIGAGWAAESFEAAIAAPPRAEDRTRLVGDLVAQFFSAYRGVATANAEAFVPLDDGLAIISKHARSLGYDAVVFFLDELILWLASHSADFQFVNREGQKLAKLVEAQSPDRPVPIVSFVARQRDLRELVGDHVTGAEQLSFGDVLKWWEARFHTITLEDRNLPAIAEKRLLKPRSEAARQQLDQAFRETTAVREDVMNALLTSTADRDMFRKVYPFSPALVQSLVAVSSMLQRERTALKVMLQILVNQRDTLKVGDIVPVGDLFDAIAEGDEAFTEAMRLHFENAKKLYHQKLLPMLEREHGVKREEAATLNGDDARAIAFKNDDRLVKTLLLSALVPEVEALKSLTAGRLAALNHGTIKSPIPGREGQLVLNKCRHWAGEAGEIRIGEESTNPTISIQITGVDTESIIENARVNDNYANRLRKVRDLLFEQLGIENRDELFIGHEFLWRGTKRSCEILFSNVRELPDESLKAGMDWKVVLDFPFDVENYTSADDLARLEKFEKSHPATRTFAWLPFFFSRETLKELATLTILDHILTGERFGGYAAHLAAVDRIPARSLLENRRSQLRQRVVAALEGAYAVATALPGSIDTTHFSDAADHFRSLDTTFQPSPPVGATLGEALGHLLNQLLSHQFPAHPRFEGEVKLLNLRKVYEEVQKATQVEDGRVPVDRPLRPVLRQIADPLRIGTMSETHFVLGHHWRQHFQRKAAEDGGPTTVGKLRAWIDEPSPMGLLKEVRNLLILVFADQTNQTFFLHGGPYQPSLELMPDELELREQKLPPKDDWERAASRAASVFGLVTSPLRNAANVAELSAAVRQKAEEQRAANRLLVTRLREHAAGLGVPGDSPRLLTAEAVAGMLEGVLGARPENAVGALASAKVATSEAAMGASLKNAQQLLSTLEAINWEIFSAVRSLKDERAGAAQAMQKRLEEAFGHDELAVPLASTLKSVQSDAVKLLTSVSAGGSPSTAGAPPPSPLIPPTQPLSGAKPIQVVEEAGRTGLGFKEATAILDGLKAKLEKDPSLRIDMSWRVTRPAK